MKRSRFLRLLLLAPLGGQGVVASDGVPDDSVAYLLRSQSPDGAWRSSVYGAFRDGRALTPVVLRGLARVGHPDGEEAIGRATDWLLRHRETLFQSFPVHAASAILEAGVHVPAIGGMRDAAVRRLLELQGGRDAAWSYSPVPPPDDGGILLAPMQQANLSATAIAIDGLRAAGGQDATIARALPFVRKCQNFGTGEAAFDDGGFFQMVGDPARNKAGRAGVDGSGLVRYRSYAAATADGLRSLLAAGCAAGSPEVAAARGWLDRYRWTVGGGAEAPPDLAYYRARSIGLTTALAGGRTTAARGLAGELMACRRADGSWMNPAGEMRENCPIVATSLALEGCLAFGSG